MDAQQLGQDVADGTVEAGRLEDGRAVLVAYEIYRQGNRYGQPPG